MSEVGIRVVARFSAEAANVERVREILSELISPTRSEAGCVTYDLLQNIDDPTDLTFVEEWTSRQALGDHLASDHIASARSALTGLLKGEVQIGIYKLI